MNKIFKQAIYDMLPSPFTSADVRRVALELGCTCGTVAQWGRAFGRVGPGRYDKLPSAKKVVEMIEGGMRPAEVAKKYGTSRPAIYSRIKGAGLRLSKGQFSPIDDQSPGNSVSESDKMVA